MGIKTLGRPFDPSQEATLKFSDEGAEVDTVAVFDSLRNALREKQCKPKQRFSIRLSRRELDTIAQSSGATSRSSALEEILRKYLEELKAHPGSQNSVARSSVSFSDDLVQELRTVADAFDTTPSQLIHDALRCSTNCAQRTDDQNLRGLDPWRVVWFGKEELERRSGGGQDVKNIERDS